MHAQDMVSMFRRQLQKLNSIVDGGLPEERRLDEEVLEGLESCENQTLAFVFCLIDADDCDADACIDSIPSQGKGCSKADDLAEDLGTCCDSQCEDEAATFVECAADEFCAAAGIGKLVSFGAALLLGISMMVL